MVAGDGGGVEGGLVHREAADVVTSSRSWYAIVWPDCRLVRRENGRCILRFLDELTASSATIERIQYQGSLHGAAMVSKTYRSILPQRLLQCIVAGTP